MEFPAPGRIGRPLRASASEGIDTMLAGLTALLLACSTLGSSDLAAPDTLRYAVSMQGSRAGTELVWEGMEARYRASFDRMLYEAIGVAP